MLEETRHNLETGDQVILSEIEGMEELKRWSVIADLMHMSKGGELLMNNKIGFIDHEISQEMSKTS